MAQRFGGAFSPKGQKGAGGAAAAHPSVAPRVARLRRARVGGRSNALFLLPLPFAIAAFRAEPVGLALNLSALGLLLLAAWLTREGLRAEETYETRAVARRPAIPRKIFASIATGLGLLAGGLADGSVIAGVIYAIFGAGLHSAAFGLDPLTDKGGSDMDLAQSDRASRAIDRAETHLSAMRAAITSTHDRALLDRVQAFEDTARGLFQSVAADPRDLTGARKFLGVYLEGARGAAEKYAGMVAIQPAPEKRAEFLTLLDDMDANFAERTRKALDNDAVDLEVEISVLRERLAREGIRTFDASLDDAPAGELPQTSHTVSKP